MQILHLTSFFFFFNDTATTEIYTLSLHDALPISGGAARDPLVHLAPDQAEGLEALGRELHVLVLVVVDVELLALSGGVQRSEEHTSELQSQSNIVCRLLLEKKKKQ